MAGSGWLNERWFQSIIPDVRAGSNSPALVPVAGWPEEFPRKPNAEIAVNEELGTNLRFETVETLPEGGAFCLRRFWVEETP